MTKMNINITIDTLLENAKKYIKNKDSLDLIKKAYFFALDKHEGQDRRTG